jgi:nitroreductase
VPIGAFHDDQVQTALGLLEDHEPLYLIPVGHPRE